MGCDIHMFVERKTSDNNYGGPKDISDNRDFLISNVLDEGINERWVSADDWEYEDGHWQNIEIYNFRNYYLFSILAGVRNGGYVEPISEPRGIPKDCSYGYKYSCEMWKGDAHSHSYFTLEELLNIDWSIYDKHYINIFLNTIEELKRIDKDPKKVRICFFFDN